MCRSCRSEKTSHLRNSRRLNVRFEVLSRNGMAIKLCQLRRFSKSCKNLPVVLFSFVSLVYLIKTERGSIFKRVLNYYYHNLALRYMQYMGLLLFCLFVCFLSFSFNSLSNNCGFF